MSTIRTARRAVVIGGGVIGVACAHYLLRDGWQVTLLDRAGVGSGSSHGNCGFICPSHVLPLAEPGMVMKGIKSLFARTRRSRSSRGSTRRSGRGSCISPHAATSAT